MEYTSYPQWNSLIREDIHSCWLYRAVSCGLMGPNLDNGFQKHHFLLFLTIKILLFDQKTSYKTFLLRPEPVALWIQPVVITKKYERKKKLCLYPQIR